MIHVDIFHMFALGCSNSHGNNYDSVYLYVRVSKFGSCFYLAPSSFILCKLYWVTGDIRVYHIQEMSVLISVVLKIWFSFIPTGGIAF